MNIENLIERLEAAWDVGGVLHAIRCGKFDLAAGQEFLNLVSSISIPDDELVPKRLLSLLWMLSVFLEWQVKSVASVNGDTVAYEKFINDVETTLERVLGVP